MHGSDRRLVQYENIDGIRELQRRVFANHELYFDVELATNTRRGIQRLLTDVHVVGLFKSYSSYYLNSSMVFLLLTSRNIAVGLIDCGATIKTASGRFQVG